ncbi:MAG: MFS transporter [Ferroplasma sp.]
MNRKYSVLMITTISTLMAAIDSTIVYLAMPAIGKAFNSGISDLSLIVIAYLIAAVIMLIPSIEIIKKIGNKTFYIIGFIIFTASSLFIALSFNITMLVSLRFLEGIGAGIMTSSDIPIILSVFKSHEKGKAIGLNSIAWSVGTLLGPVLGGFLVSVDWRYIFLINVPIGIIAIILGKIIIPPGHSHKARIKFLSAISMAIFMIPLAAGIAMLNIYYLIASAAIFPFFMYAQYRDPLIERVLLKNIRFSLITLASFLESFIFFSVLFALSLYFEVGLGFNSIDAGLILFTYPAAAMISSPIGGMLYDSSRNPEALMIAGVLLECIPVLFIAMYFKFIPELLFLAGFGGSLFWSPSTTMVTDVMGEHYRVQANNSLFILRDMGIIIGISILPLFIKYFSGINVTLGSVFEASEVINITAGISAYLIFTALLSMSSIIFIILFGRKNSNIKKSAIS